MDKQEITLALLEHYHEEWLHRHSHYWKILPSIYITNLIIICFPLCCSYFDMNIHSTGINPKIFPVAGILFAIVCCYLLFAESKKIITLRKEINSRLNLLTDTARKQDKTNYVTKYINYIIASILSIVMVLISCYVISIL